MCTTKCPPAIRTVWKLIKTLIEVSPCPLQIILKISFRVFWYLWKLCFSTHFERKREILLQLLVLLLYLAFKSDWQKQGQTYLTNFFNISYYWKAPDASSFDELISWWIMMLMASWWRWSKSILHFSTDLILSFLWSCSSRGLLLNRTRAHKCNFFCDIAFLLFLLLG